MLLVAWAIGAFREGIGPILGDTQMKATVKVRPLQSISVLLEFSIIIIIVLADFMNHFPDGQASKAACLSIGDWISSRSRGAAIGDDVQTQMFQYICAPP